jgi:hypothetical protein
MTHIRNPFHDRQLRAQFDVMVGSYFDPNSTLRVNGIQRRGASHRDAFWNGFNGIKSKYVKTSAAYAAFRAGQLVAKNEQLA